MVPGRAKDNRDVVSDSRRNQDFSRRRLELTERTHMGTDVFRADVSNALAKFLVEEPKREPEVLKVNYRDAMGWHTGEKSQSLIQDFVNQDVKSYVDTIPFRKSLLRCTVKLLNVDDDTPTHFE
jgi:hypothetical protein